MTLFIIVYLLALCCYFYTRTGDNIKYRAINKYIMATMYLVFAIVVFFQRYRFASYQTLLMAALLFAYFGDIFLVFDFGRGGDFFLAGNICFILYEQIVMVDHGFSVRHFWWSFLLAGLVLGCLHLCLFQMAKQDRHGQDALADDLVSFDDPDPRHDRPGDGCFIARDEFHGDGNRFLPVHDFRYGSDGLPLHLQKQQVADSAEFPDLLYGALTDRHLHSLINVTGSKRSCFV